MHQNIILFLIRKDVKVNVITGGSRVQHSPHFWFREREREREQPDRLSQTLSPTSFQSRSKRCQARHVALAYPTTARNPHTTLPNPPNPETPPSALHLPPLRHREREKGRKKSPASNWHPPSSQRKRVQCFSSTCYVYSQSSRAEKKQKQDKDGVREKSQCRKWLFLEILVYCNLVPKQTKS